MRPYEPDVGNLKFVLDCNHQSIGITFDIEYNPVITENSGCPVFRFNVPWTLPLCLFRFSIPRSQGLFRTIARGNEGPKTFLQVLAEIIYQA